MLYPDLGRLALARACATGGTHDAEAGGSNDPPPPKRGRPEGGAAGPAETEVMGDPDLLPLILSAPDTKEACKLAVRWCASHRGACDDLRWGELRKLVFPYTVDASAYFAELQFNSDTSDTYDLKVPVMQQESEPSLSVGGTNKRWFYLLCQAFFNWKDARKVRDKARARVLAGKPHRYRPGMQSNWNIRGGPIRPELRAISNDQAIELAQLQLGMLLANDYRPGLHLFRQPNLRFPDEGGGTRRGGVVFGGDGSGRRVLTLPELHRWLAWLRYLDSKAGYQDWQLQGLPDGALAPQIVPLARPGFNLPEGWFPEDEQAYYWDIYDHDPPDA